MSYDLYFWRQASDLALPPAEICEAIASNNPPPGLLVIDVETALLRIEQAFPGSSRSSHQVVWQGNDPRAGSFVVGWSRVHIYCECHQLPAEAMNQLIDIGIAIDCKLYDPQTAIRFDGSTTPNDAPAYRPVSTPAEVEVGPDGWTRCPNCRRRFKVADENVYKDGRHTKCGQTLALIHRA